MCIAGNSLKLCMNKNLKEIINKSIQIQRHKMKNTRITQNMNCITCDYNNLKKKQLIFL